MATDQLLNLLVVLAVVAIGLALLIPHALTKQVLALGGTIVAAAVALFLLLR